MEEILPHNLNENENKKEIDPKLRELLEKAKADIDSHESWLKRTSRSEDEIEESLARYKEGLIEDVKWEHYFSNKGIPDSWSIWYNITEYFKEAAKNNEQLDANLIDAGISHPHHLVALETAKSQKLTIQQLAYVFIRDLPMWNFQEIIQAQKDKGMTDSQIMEAQEYAKQYMEKLKTNKLDSANDGLLDLRVTSLDNNL